MIRFNPRALFEKVFAPRFVWAKVNPVRPHASISGLSEEESPDWAAGFRILKANLEDANRFGLMGRIIDWDKFTPEERRALETRSLNLPLKRVLSIIRPLSLD